MKLRIFTEPQEGASYKQQLRVAQAAESLGFDAFLRSDHYLAMSGGLPGPTDSWVTLGVLARETSRVRLGTLVTPVTFRSPGVLAISVAQVDQMTTRHRHRSLADAGRRALRLHRVALHGREFARPTEAGPAAASAHRDRWQWATAFGPARGGVRRRVQRGLRHPGADLRGLPGRRSRLRRRWSVGGLDALVGGTPNERVHRLPTAARPRRPRPAGIACRHGPASDRVTSEDREQRLRE